MRDGNKLHRVHKKGGKVAKKKKVKRGGESANNSKAFKFRSAVKARKLIRRAADLSEKKKHIPIIDRVSDIPPPLLVAIVGASKVGKSTLLRCLIKNYVRQSITEIKGPVTVVTSKKQRVTFFEVPNDINAMIDVAKVADLVLILIDASYGFEMEVFEFIHICQVHGMPKIMGVLTHMDKLRKNKIKSLKKQLKQRFWTELYPGAKLFYLTGIEKNRYFRHEIKNLGRFISVAKLRPILWRNSHPYIFCDRYEDLTDPELLRNDPKANRRISLYGYIRGVSFKNNSDIHIPGVGDLRVTDITVLSDPCPLPINQKAKRTLNEREQILYAPFSGLGGLVYDNNAVYIDVGGSQSFKKKNRNELIDNFDNINEPLDIKIEKASLKLLSGNPDMEINLSGQDSGMESEEESDNGEEEENYQIKPTTSTSVNGLQFDELHGLANKLSGNFTNGTVNRTNWSKSVYESNEDGLNIEQAIKKDITFGGGLFRVPTDLINTKNKIFLKDKEDGHLYIFNNFYPSEQHLNWELETVRDLIRDLFVTKENVDDDCLIDNEDESKNYLKSHTGKFAVNESENDSSGDEFDSEELLNAEIKHSKHNNAIFDDSDVEDDEEGQGESTTDNEKNKMDREKRRDRLKQQFDADFDQTNEHYNALKDEVEKQSKLNKSIFEHLDEGERGDLEGFRPGLYVRLQIDVLPASFVECFNPHFPYIIGGLLPGEQNNGYVQTRIKKHRWYERLLKSRDPLIISCGWRRFQSMVIYSILDHNHRQRFIKYSPKEAFCNGMFWAPFVTQNTGFLGLQSIDENMRNFRIAASGVILGMDKSTNIVKKLKLIGQPLEIFKKTAFVKGMFNSALEVAKFQGAAIRTVSGIRGLVKKPIREPDGAFRASFEDKIQINDIIFLRSWINVTVPQFYVSMTDKLMPSAEKWLGMKTVGRLRYELGIKPEQKLDSGYHRHLKHELTEKPFASSELIMPRKLQKELPYKLKPKLAKLTNKRAEQESTLVVKHTALVLEPNESKMHAMMKMLHTVKKAKRECDKQQTIERQKKYKKELAEINAKRKKKMMETKKARCRNLSKREAKKLKDAMETIGA